MCDVTESVKPKVSTHPELQIDIQPLGSYLLLTDRRGLVRDVCKEPSKGDFTRIAVQRLNYDRFRAKCERMNRRGWTIRKTKLYMNVEVERGDISTMRRAVGKEEIILNLNARRMNLRSLFGKIVDRLILRFDTIVSRIEESRSRSSLRV